MATCVSCLEEGVSLRVFDRRVCLRETFSKGSRVFRFFVFSFFSFFVCALAEMDLECTFGKDVRSNLKRFRIVFNEAAVSVITKQRVPVYVKFVASLGKSFNFPSPFDESALIDAFVCLEKVHERCDNPVTWHEMDAKVNVLRSELPAITSIRPNVTAAQAYVLHLMDLSKTFLAENPSIVIVPSDKGGKAVIMDEHAYMTKMRAYVRENIDASNYRVVDSPDDVRPFVEELYSNVAAAISPFLELDRTSFVMPSRCHLVPGPFMIPLMYGCPKIHKVNIPMRPIIASADMIGRPLSTWLLERLKAVASLFNKHNVKNSSELIPDLKSFRVEPGHRLYALDYDSMFTNVDVQQTIAIIVECYHVIASSTTVPADVFIMALRFFTDHATFFQFDGVTYQQIKGLAMGNRLAQILAEIRTNHALLQAMSKYDAHAVSFLYKYVDDIFGAIHSECIDALVNDISTAVKMKLTTTAEDKNNDVEYLDCVFRRNEDFSVSHRWFKKQCSSFAVLNYHSYHPWNMKRDVIAEMARKAFHVTSPFFYEQTKDLLSLVLYNSSYPERTVLECINGLLRTRTHTRSNFVAETSSERIHKRTTNEHDCRTYVSCPYDERFIDRLSLLISEFDLNISLAPRPMMSNRRSIFTLMKDQRDPQTKGRSIFSMKCEHCDFRSVHMTGAFDVARTAYALLKDEGTPVNVHWNAAPSHRSQPLFSIIKTFSNDVDVKHSRSAISYLNRIKNVVAPIACLSACDLVAIGFAC